ncbi:MAG: hypothetical protein GY936_14225, partial [Ignavibacteriae bacterium]|nr:hypothetical protein [Ignavibacteriota bacterium]
MAKSERTKLADKIHSILRLAKLEIEPSCVTCDGSSGDNVLQLGHLITRGKWSVRFDHRNLHTQCRTCNLKHEYYPEVYNNWFVNKYGIEEYNRLVKDSNQLKQYKIRELRDLLAELK